MRALDLPPPSFCQIERTADLAGAAARHVGGRALDLAGGLGTVLPELGNHGAECTNQTQRDIVGNEHVFLGIHL
jgi:hypothetical protein